jgi:hypothetical protein
VHGEDNVADGLIKHVERIKMESTCRGVDSCDAKGDMNSALILETLECSIKLNGFTADVHPFISPLPQPLHVHQLRRFALHVDQSRISFGCLDLETLGSL